MDGQQLGDDLSRMLKILLVLSGIGVLALLGGTGYLIYRLVS